MDRQQVAYLLIAILVAAAVAGIAYLRHNTHQRRYQRRKTREQAARTKRMGDRP